MRAADYSHQLSANLDTTPRRDFYLIIIRETSGVEISEET